jgi:DNA-binding MarR family transcriptional regulator
MGMTVRIATDFMLPKISYSKPITCRFTMTAPHHQYFDFLIAKSSQTLLQRLDPASEKFLELIALENFKGSNLTMMRALGFAKNLALSPSTLAKRIRLLQQMNLIEIHVDDADRRIKTLYPTKKTSSYFSLLSEQIVKANLGNSKFS